MKHIATLLLTLSILNTSCGSDPDSTDPETSDAPDESTLVCSLENPTGEDFPYTLVVEIRDDRITCSAIDDTNTVLGYDENDLELDCIFSMYFGEEEEDYSIWTISAGTHLVATLNSSDELDGTTKLLDNTCVIVSDE